MIRNRSARRAAVVTAVTLVPLAVFGGVGLAKGNPSGSEYQDGPSGGQYGKVTVCHATHSKKHHWVTIRVALAAWNHAHSHHGDFQVDATHPCPPTTAAPTAPTTHGNSGTHGNGGDHGNNGHHGKP